MATNTPNLVLRKPDPADLVNVQTDLNGNWDKLDAAAGSWTAYAPVWGGTGVAIGNGSITGRYLKAGKTVDLHVFLQLGTTSTVGTGNWSLSLPAGVIGKVGVDVFLAAGMTYKAATGLFPITVELLTGGSTFRLLAVVNAASSNLGFVQWNNPGGAWASGDYIRVSARFEIN